MTKNIRQKTLYSINLSTRLHYALDRAGVPRRGRAQYVLNRLPYKISIVAVRKWLSGETSPVLSKLQDLVIIADTTLEYLLGDAEYQSGNADASYEQRIGYKVPVLTAEQVRPWLNNQSRKDLKSTLTSWEFITAGKLSASAFAIEMKGSTMTNPHGFPSIPEKSIVLIDPASQVESGSFVAVLIPSGATDEISIKKLEVDGEQKILFPLNPIFQTTPLNKEWSIIGKVVFVMQKLDNLSK